MKEIIFGLYLKTKSLHKSVKNFNRLHLMDYVIYDGKLCFINNGTRFPDWDLIEVTNNTQDERKSYRVNKNDFKKLFWRNLKHDLFYTHRWYMDCWYSIELHKMLEKEVG